MLFSSHLAQELLSKKIRVLSISPGNIKFRKGRWEEIIKNKRGVNKFISENVGMKRFGTAKEIAYLYYVLMSKNNSFFMTGSNIIADGLQLKKII